MNVAAFVVLALSLAFPGDSVTVGYGSPAWLTVSVPQVSYGMPIFRDGNWLRFAWNCSSESRSVLVPHEDVAVRAMFQHVAERCGL